MRALLAFVITLGWMIAFVYIMVWIGGQALGAAWPLTPKGMARAIACAVMLGCDVDSYR